jgi:hypothetical protein
VALARWQAPVAVPRKLGRVSAGRSAVRRCSLRARFSDYASQPALVRARSSSSAHGVDPLANERHMRKFSRFALHVRHAIFSC